MLWKEQLQNPRRFPKCTQTVYFSFGCARANTWHLKSSIHSISVRLFRARPFPVSLLKYFECSWVVEWSWPFCGQDLWFWRDVHIRYIKGFLISYKYTFFLRSLAPSRYSKLSALVHLHSCQNFRILFIFLLLCLFFSTVQLSFPVDVCLSDPSKCFTPTREWNTKPNKMKFLVPLYVVSLAIIAICDKRALGWTILYWDLMVHTAFSN